MAYDYQTLNAADLLRLARERFQALELDHARVSLTNEPTRDERLAEYEAELAKIKQRIALLEPETAEVPLESPTTKASEIPVEPPPEDDKKLKKR